MTHPLDPAVAACAAADLKPLPIDVVSVQSQVVYGRVGNNVAMPALAAQGLIAAAVPTVVFSNTPHYPSIYGGAIPIDWFQGYLRGLVERDGLARLKGVLTGYLGGPEQAQILGGWIRQTLERRPGLCVVIDPVLGDRDTGEYVKPEMADAYLRDLLPWADGLTPNDFELQRLTGQVITDMTSAIAAAKSLLVGRTRWVVVTSAAPDTWSDSEMQVLVVTRDRHEILCHPRVDATPKGTGDLFAATLMGRLLSGLPVFEATAQACDLVISALRCTQREQCGELLLPAAMAQSGETVVR